MNKIWLSKKGLLGLLLSLILGVIVLMYMTNRVYEKSRWQTMQDAEIITSKIKEDIVRYDSVLHGLRAFLNSEQKINNKNIADYVNNLPQKEDGISKIFFISLASTKDSQIISLNEKANKVTKEDFLSSIKEYSLIDQENTVDKMKSKVLNNGSIVINLPILNNNKTTGIVGILLPNKIPFVVPANIEKDSVYYQIISLKTYKIVYEAEKSKENKGNVYYDIRMDWDKISFITRVYSRKTNQILFSDKLYFISAIFTCFLYLGIIVVLSLMSSHEKAQLVVSEMTREMKHIGWHDSLTNLYNRYKISEELDFKISSMKNKSNRLFLLCIDLQGFKRVNDELGHHFGDLLLQEYANRLMNRVPGIFEAVARAGGDEFLVFIDAEHLNENSFLNQLKIIEEEFDKITQEPFSVKEELFTIKNKIGISIYPDHGHNAEELFKFAELAMYEAKVHEDIIFVYQTELAKKLTILNKMKSALAAGLENNEFYLVYQPKILLNENQITKQSAEVLCRWNSSVFGNVSPDVFINLAEETGEIHRLGKWVMIESIKQLAIWNTEGIDITLSINISPKQLMNEKLPFEFNAIARQYGINPNKISLEITENSMISDKKQSQIILNQFYDYGFKLSIDDFGKGYSSLSYLKDYPISEIKMDKGFIDDIVENKFNEILVEGIILVSNKLNIDLIIEGVETKEQVEFLFKMGCSKYQGYYFSKPLSAQDFVTYIKHN